MYNYLIVHEYCEILILSLEYKLATYNVEGNILFLAKENNLLNNIHKCREGVDMLIFVISNSMQAPCALNHS